MKHDNSRSCLQRRNGITSSLKLPYNRTDRESDEGMNTFRAQWVTSVDFNVLSLYITTAESRLHIMLITNNAAAVARKLSAVTRECIQNAAIL
jgi:hypothetical protein